MKAQQTKRDDRDISVPIQRVVPWPAQKRMPPLSVANLRVSDDIPTPRRYQQAGKYDGLFERLVRDGQSITGIPVEYRKVLTCAKQAYLKLRPELAARSRFIVARVDEQTCGIWRVAKEGRT